MAAPVQTMPHNRQIYAVLRTGPAGNLILHLCETEPDVRDPVAVFVWRGMLPAHAAVALTLASDPTKNPALQVAVPLGTATIAQTATVAVSAGVRQLTVTLAGVKAGDNILLFPIDPLPPGYALLGAVVSAGSRLQVTMQTPALAIGAAFSIACRAVRLG